MAFDFRSPGADAYDSIVMMLAKRQAEQRQTILDQLSQKNVESQIADREANRKIRAQEAQNRADTLAQSMADRKATQQETRANRVVSELPPNTSISPETGKLLEETGRGDLKKTNAPYAFPGFLDQSNVRDVNPGEQAGDVFKGTAAQQHTMKAEEQANERLRQADERANKPKESAIHVEYNDYKNEMEAMGKKPVDFETYMNDDANRKAKAAGTANGITPNKEVELITGLGNQWSRLEGTAREMVRQYSIMQSGLKRFDADPNGASQAVLVTFQKMLDPLSVVRESEYARSSAGISLLQRIEGYAQRLAAGGAGVPKAELNEMVKTAREFYNGANSSIAGQRGRIEAVANKYKIDPKLITTTPLELPNEEGSMPAAAAAAPGGAGVRKYDPASGTLK